VERARGSAEITRVAIAGAQSRPELGVRAVGRSLSILLALAESGADGFSLEEVARRTDLAKSTAHRLLETLGRSGFAEPARRSGAYRLGTSAVIVGSAAIRVHRPKDGIQQVLRRVRDATDETVGLGTLAGSDVLSVGRELSSQSLHWNSAVGSRMPAACSAAGKVLLAGLDPADVNAIYKGAPLPQPTGRSPKTAAELVVQLALVREQGYAIDDEEFLAGLRCVAVPVHDGNGHVAYAFGISGPSARLSLERLAEALPLLVEAATEIESILVVDEPG
jgi:IclR family acetate operon transcriptional repressor